ncbi:hypothetical protein C8R45DRAFT_1081499 [Mycena sanguinolenta]|nr:hypothetical protein C8R45DRAFT_1081499 [Mycena sanguinolenta]
MPVVLRHETVLPPNSEHFLSLSAPSAARAGSLTRFVREVERRDAVAKPMRGCGAACARGARSGRGEEPFFMKRYPDAAASTEDTGILLDNILSTFASDRKDDDVFGTARPPFLGHHQLTHPHRSLCVVIIAPVVHYTMGGLAVDTSARVMRSSSIVTRTPPPPTLNSATVNSSRFPRVV